MIFIKQPQVFNTISFIGKRVKSINRFSEIHANCKDYLVLTENLRELLDLVRPSLNMSNLQGAFYRSINDQ